MSRVLVRADDATIEDAKRLVDALHWGVPYGLLIQTAGSAVTVESDSAWSEPDLRRARAVEIAGLLHWGEAIWSPTNYHYVLPSGRHISSFIKVGDAIREPRDAEVIASWFTPLLRDRLGIVIDSGTLAPVATAIQNWMLRGGLEGGRVVVLENYPRTELDARAAIRAANEDDAVLAIISVSSSGRLRDRMVRALEIQPDAVSWSLHVLVDSASPVVLTPELDSWLPHDALSSPAKRSVEPSHCGLCRDPERAMLVPIHARSFQGMLPGQTRRLMPDVESALANREFWQLCDEANGLGMAEPPAEPLRPFRGSGELMGVRVRLENLISDSSFVGAIAERLQLPSETPDVVLVPEAETGLPGFEAFWAELQQLVPLPSCSGFPLDSEWPKQLRDQIGQARSILVFALGTVTGSSLQRALVSVQSIRRDANRTDYELDARVVNARPALKREWETLLNSYGRAPDRLQPLWLTFLPDASPLADEQRVLNNLTLEERTTAEDEEFLKRRLQLSAGQLTIDEEPLFWGSRLTDCVTPHSIFGERIRAPTVYAAVGSALETRRLNEAQSHLPELRRFEMRAIVRSYYDPLILAALLRWLRPGEADWGEDFGYGGSAVAGEIIERARHVEPDHLRILIPELLLACALGKFDLGGQQQVLAQGRIYLDTLQDPAARAPVAIGLMAARRGVEAPDSETVLP